MTRYNFRNEDIRDQYSIAVIMKKLWKKRIVLVIYDDNLVGNMGRNIQTIGADPKTGRSGDTLI